MRPKRRILFAISEAGSAAFCMPLWRKWISQGMDFTIIGDDAASNMIARYHLNINVRPWGRLPPIEDFDVLVSSATGNEFEAVIGAWARGHGIKTIQFLDAPYDTQNRILKSNPPGHYPDKLLVIHSCVKEDAITAGILPKAVEIIGHPNWEEYINSGIQKGPDHVIAFAAQPISEISQLDLGYNEQDVWEILCLAKNKAPNIIKELIYCPHPAQTRIPHNFDTGTKLLKSGEDPLKSAGIMVSMYAAVVVEAYLSGLKVISLQPNLKVEDRSFLSKLGLIKTLKTADPQGLIEHLCMINQKPQSGLEDFKNTIRFSLSRFESSIFS